MRTMMMEMEEREPLRILSPRGIRLWTKHPSPPCHHRIDDHDCQSCTINIVFKISFKVAKKNLLNNINKILIGFTDDVLLFLQGHCSPWGETEVMDNKGTILLRL